MKSRRTFLASLNLNRGMTTDPRGGLFRAWLDDLRPDVLMLQETQAPHARVLGTLDDYERVCGTTGSTVWRRAGGPPVAVVQDRETWGQTIRLDGDVLVHHVHLAPSSGSERAAQLADLAALDPGRMKVVVGDFNLAPRPEDGVFGDSPSTFTSASERRALAGLVAGQGLCDILACRPPEFTFHRRVRGRSSAFRCDLALVDRRLPHTYAAYDHSVRPRISDHSAIVLSIPADAGVPAAPGRDTPLQEARPDRTAMSRRDASPWARWISSELAPAVAVTSVLDYGCGRGRDVRFLRDAGIDATGYDPAPAHGATELPAGTFDLVTLIFVLNTIATPAERVAALKAAASKVAPGGKVLVVARSDASIARAATRGGWQGVGDGFWSSDARRTFQHGLSTTELRHIGACAGLRPVSPVPPAAADAVAQLFSPREVTA